MVLYDRHRGVRRLVTPRRVGRTPAAVRDAEIGAIPLVGAVRGVVSLGEERHVDVLARNVLHRRIARFSQDQRVPSIGNDAARNLDHDSISVTRNRDWVIRAWYLDRLRLLF